MNIFKRITNKIKTSPKKTTALVATLTLLAVPAIVLAGFGPDRPTYDYNKFVDGVSCTDPSQDYGRCGSMDGPVFNSFIHTPTYGDERNFGRVAEVVPGQSPTDADFGETKTAQAGKEYWVRTFVHNNANEATNGPEFDNIGIAHNTRVKVAIADGVANGVDVMSYVSASNATPGTVWDSSTLVNNNQAFSVAYVPGSAVIYNSAHQNGLALSDAIVSNDGVQIGHNAMNGELPGCFDYSAYVYVKVKVQAPELKFEKLVRHDGETSDDWTDEIHASTGDQVEYLLDYLNTGSEVMNNIVLSDQLPSNMELVPGSVKWIDSNRPNGTPVPDDLLFDPAGVTVGNYGVNGGGYIFFEARVKQDVDECVARNVAFARADNVPQQEDDAVVIIDDCNPVVPVVSCNSLTATSLGERRFRYTLSYTAENATLKTIQYDFGDNTTPLLTTNTTVEHQYAQDGTYTTTTRLTFDVDGEERVITDADCTAQVSASTPRNFCPIPGKENLPADSPECRLPDTGMGEIFGLFTATTVAGAAAHHVFSTRKFTGSL